MSRFKLDTSGEVAIPAINAMTGEPDRIWIGYRWSDLSPFAQGYIEAAFEGGIALYDGAEVPRVPLGFSDLAPGTLAAMLEDCDWFCESALGGPNPYTLRDREAGGLLWVKRQEGTLPSYAPVHLYLADDGKIHQREVGQ